jgi:hypothetical protein
MSDKPPMPTVPRRDRVATYPGDEPARILGALPDGVDPPATIAHWYVTDREAELLAVLRAVEWQGTHEDWAACPECGGMKPGPGVDSAAEGHFPDCRLAAALKGAP